MSPVRPLLSLMLGVLFAALFALATGGTAHAVEKTFAGSAQFDYHIVPSPSDANGRALSFDGFTTEASLKLVVDLTDQLSANVKVCYGCHGFETDMAYMDFRVADELAFRAGRINASFGAFNLRHDPGNHRLSDKPLPYDMGRMLRLRDWNMGVLPSPFPDNGVEVSGTHWFGGKAQLDYAVYGISGFKGAKDGTDLDFVQSRSGSAYYVDNNNRPTLGGRLSLTAKLSEVTDLTVGSSFMYGTFDPANKQTYAIAGADVSLRIDRTSLRAEYLVRRQTFDDSDPTRFKFATPATGGDFFSKHGAYVELEHPLSDRVDGIVRVDGMFREGNVLAGSALSRKSAVGRFTLGTSILVVRSFRLKGSTELWGFSDEDARGHVREVSFHVGSVVTF